jgi:hypothetical protein
MASAVRVEGLRDLNKALARADRDVRLGVRKALREVAEPVRADAERLAASEIRNLNEGDPWSRMRVGVTKTLVYVAPKKRGSKRGLQKRTNLAPLLAGRAMEPALEQNEDNVERAMQHVIDTAADRFNR